MSLRVSGSFKFVSSMMSEVTQEDCESQSDGSQKHSPSHGGYKSEVDCLNDADEKIDESLYSCVSICAFQYQ